MHVCDLETNCFFGEIFLKRGPEIISSWHKLLWESGRKGVWDKREAVSLRSPNLNPQVLVCLEIARWSGRSSGRLGLAAWFWASHSSTVSLQVAPATNTIQHKKRGLLGIRTWLPCVTSPRPSHRFIHSFVLTDNQSRVRWGVDATVSEAGGPLSPNQT